MSETEIPDLLDRAADRVEVSAPPVGAMIRDARGQRRRRGLGLIGAAAAAVTVLGGTAYVVGSGDLAGSDAGVVSPDDAVPEIPDGYRLVAIGRVAIAVPEEWGTNQTQCGKPMKDTVVIDHGPIPRCSRPLTVGVTSVSLREGGVPQDLAPIQVEETDIDGQAVVRQSAVCVTFQMSPPVTSCGGAVYFRGLGVEIVASSSTQPPEPTARAKVDEILSRVMVLDESSVGVPGFRDLEEVALEHRGEQYAARLRELGLTAEIVSEKQPAAVAGFVLGVVPTPGTVVPRGSTVRVTVAGPR